MRRLAYTRLPSSNLELGERTFVGRTPVDVALAHEQHVAYRAALERMGFEVRVLEALPAHPDGVFVEDPLLLLDEVSILTRPAAPSRRAELEAAADLLATDTVLCERPVERIESPATLEGGDVLPLDGLLLVGQSTRTDHAGLKQLAHLALPYGYRVKAAAVSGCLHLKTGCTALDDETLLANPNWVDLHRSPDMRILHVDPGEPFAANLIAADGHVLLSASHPRTAELLSAHGLEVHAVHLSEFEKAEAGPTCLSLRTRLS